MYDASWNNFSHPANSIAHPQHHDSQFMRVDVDRVGINVVVVLEFSIEISEYYIKSGYR